MLSDTLESIKRAGIAAAYRGAEVLNARLGSLAHIQKKGRTDLVTEADTGSEKAIIASLGAAFPEHAILAEESGLCQGAAGAPMWIIDPLDGTTNYAHQLELFAISIAHVVEGKLAAGIVLIPRSGELFTAVAGQGAQRNGLPIRVSTTAAVADSLLATGFPYDVAPILSAVVSRFTNCLESARGIRRLGSAAIDLCYLAWGRFDGFWEQNLKPWDTAAGVLIAREAGAVVTDFSDRPFGLEKNEILATNGRIHAEMLELMRIKGTQ